MTRQLTAAPRALCPAPARLSYREFLRTYLGDNTHCEWVDGEVVHMAPMTSGNSGLQVFLVKILSAFVGERELGEVHMEPFNMKTGPDLPGRSPDILFVSTANKHRIKKTHLEGPADLVIEVVSPSSQKLDRQDKHREYEAGGVGEYWIIDPSSKKAEFFRRGADGLFHRVRLVEGSIFRSKAVEGFWLRVEWLRHPPGFVGIMKELGII